MTKSKRLWLLALAAISLVSIAHGQTTQVDYGDAVVVFAGNSLSEFQQGIAQQDELTLLNPANVLVRGHDSYKCEDVLPLIPYDIRPDANVVLIFDGTNNVHAGTPIAQHIACIWNTVESIHATAPGAQILLANVPPWLLTNCYGDYRRSIATYNAAYAAQQWPSYVTLLDVWTPNVQPDGWAMESHINGLCGVHPGFHNVWEGGWPLFSQVTTAAIYQAIQGGAR